MDSLNEFFRKISRRLLLSEKRLQAIEDIDPQHIYVENIRAVFGISSGLAKRLCELAVRRGILAKGVEVLCPDHVVAAEAASRELLPPEVSCWQDVHGTFEQVTYATAGLQKMEFYSFRQGGAA